jgi:hypothetical protein
MNAPFPSAAELTAILASDADLQKKALACQQLAIVGGPDAVPALAALLGDGKLADYARSGLEIIATPAAGVALMKAMPGLSGRQLAGVIDSLGVRREIAAVPELIKLVKDESRGQVDEALSALGRIASDEAIATLRSSLKAHAAPQRIASAHAALVAAENLVKSGKSAAAKVLLGSVASADLPQHLRDAAVALLSKPSRRRIFDGETFDGWEGDPSWFRIAEGAVVAGSLSKAIPQNEFLCSAREFSDFELRLKVRLVDGKGNGGIQFRSKRVPDSREMEGYQADVASDYWGALYDESRRRNFLGIRPDPALVAKVLKPDDWNDYVIRCEGPRIRLWLNGQLTTDFTEADSAIPRTGNIGLQIHSGAPSEAWYKDIEIEELQVAR